MNELDDREIEIRYQSGGDRSGVTPEHSPSLALHYYSPRRDYRFDEKTLDKGEEGYRMIGRLDDMKQHLVKYIDRETFDRYYDALNAFDFAALAAIKGFWRYGRVDVEVGFWGDGKVYGKSDFLLPPDDCEHKHDDDETGELARFAQVIEQIKDETGFTEWYKECTNHE
jgi:hypothetical protein